MHANATRTPIEPLAVGEGSSRRAVAGFEELDHMRTCQVRWSTSGRVLEDGVVHTSLDLSVDGGDGKCRQSECQETRNPKEMATVNTEPRRGRSKKTVCSITVGASDESGSLDSILGGGKAESAARVHRGSRSLTPCSEGHADRD